jgi:peptide/nickel transport system substrate-binding protein
VKFTFDYILKWKFPALSNVWRNIDSVEVLQNKKVRFKLKQPYAPFVANILLKAFVAPKHIWEKIPESVNVTNPQEWNNPKPVGSGPYKFDVWKKGEYFHLIANKKHRMAPKFDGLYYIQVPSVENQMAMLEKEQAEILGWFVDKKQGDKLDSFPHLKMVAVPGHGIHEIRPNCNLKPTSDPQFRKAFQHLVNRRQMLEVTYEGFGVLCHNTPITPKLEFWNNPNIPIIEFDINKAKDILKAAGYTWDEEGRLCYP